MSATLDATSSTHLASRLGSTLAPIEVKRITGGWAVQRVAAAAAGQPAPPVQPVGQVKPPSQGGTVLSPRQQQTTSTPTKGTSSPASPMKDKNHQQNGDKGHHEPEPQPETKGGRRTWFTDEEMNRMHAEFKALDADPDGSLSATEFAKALRPLYVDTDLAKLLFNAFNMANNGKMAFAEYVYAIKVLMMGDQDEKTHLAFRIFDMDRDGSVSLREFEEVLSMMAQLTSFELPEDEPSFTTFCSRLYRKFDRTQSGDVEYKQFAAALADGRMVAACPLMNFEVNEKPSNLKGVAITFGDSQWNLIIQSLIGLKTVCTMGSCDDSKSPLNNSGASGAPYYYSASTPQTSRLAAPIHFMLSPLTLPLRAVRGVAGTTEGVGDGRLMRSSSSSMPKHVDAAAERRTYRYSADGSSNAGEGEVQFFEYAPRLFRDIRRRFGVTDKSYQYSLGLEVLIRQMVLGTLNPPRRMYSSGKSGSFFFTTHDERIILKTLPLKEVRTLQNMLPRYYLHLMDNPNTLLTLYYGLYEIRLPGQSREPVRFIAMANVFPPRVSLHQLFDLKGSTAGRSVPEAQRSGVAMKDIDFQRTKGHILINAADQNDLLAQMDRDTAYLASEGLNDYSFLIGIGSRVIGQEVCTADLSLDSDMMAFFGGGKKDPKTGALLPSDDMVAPIPPPRCLPSNYVPGMGLPGAPATVPSSAPSSGGPSVTFAGVGQSSSVEKAGSAQSKGMRRYSLGINSASDDSEAFFCGIIDILTAFDSKKVAEYGMKSLYQTNFSCIPPAEYAIRFNKFLRTLVKGRAVEKFYSAASHSWQEFERIVVLEKVPTHLYEQAVVSTGVVFATGLVGVNAFQRGRASEAEGLQKVVVPSAGRASADGAQPRRRANSLTRA